MRSLTLLVLAGTACSADIDWDCSDPAAAGWQAAWADQDQALWDATNAARALGGECPSGTYAPAEPLAFDLQLTCAAQGHALNMATNDFFDHDSLDGRSPGDRIDEAGYPWMTWAENIAAGHSSPTETVQGWLDSETGHCENLLSPAMADGGFGYAYSADATYGHYWVQAFGHR